MASPIYTATVTAPTNIAVIKYWGKADAKANTPINDSLSVTLDQADLRAVTTAAASTSFTEDRLWLNGEEEVGASENKRFRACVDGVRRLATDCRGVTKADWQTMKVHISSYNTFPTAAGLASSAAGYAALVAALAELMQAKEEFPGQLTTLARQGSGSASRSLYGGFVAWRKGSPPEWLDSKADQVAHEGHWPELRAIIAVVSDKQKDTSSTSGMSTSVATSTLLKHRAEVVVPERMKAMEAAIKAQDFVAFGRITMMDSNQFHATCLDTYPPIFYMNDVSRSIIRLVTAYNDCKGKIEVAYTFDAGPNAVLYLLEPNMVEVGALLLHYYGDKDHVQKWVNKTEFASAIASHKLDGSLLAAVDKTGLTPSTGNVKCLYATKAGPGPQVLEGECLIDPKTGLNTYIKK